jgi:hypothetical protein
VVNAACVPSQTNTAIPNEQTLHVPYSSVYLSYPSPILPFSSNINFTSTSPTLHPSSLYHYNTHSLHTSLIISLYNHDIHSLDIYPVILTMADRDHSDHDMTPAPGLEPEPSQDSNHEAEPEQNVESDRDIKCESESMELDSISPIPEESTASERRTPRPVQQADSAASPEDTAI